MVSTCRDGGRVMQAASVPQRIAFGTILIFVASLFPSLGCSHQKRPPAAPAKAKSAAGKTDKKGKAGKEKVVADATTQGAESGRTLYLQHCAACHGDRGDGKGIAARFLYPKPRDFRAGRFRLVSTANGAPSREDLASVLQRGMPGSSMPSWKQLSEQQRNLLIDEILHMRQEGLHDQIVAMLKEADEDIVESDVQEQVKERTTPGAVLEAPAIPTSDKTAAARGKEIYLKQGCGSCHGNEGRGDGVQKMVDAEGLPTRPRDFIRGIFKGNDDPASVFRRIKLGMPGTPMPASSNLTTEQISDLVQFILSLSDESARNAAIMKRGKIVAKRTDKAPRTPDDAAWDAVEESPIGVMPLWWRDDSNPNLHVKALYDGESLAIRLSWSDATPNWTAARTESFKDSAAIELYQGSDEPFLGMGSAKQPVDVWFWDADRQEGFAQPDVEYPRTVVDIYPFAETTAVETAEYQRKGTELANQPPVSLPAEATGNQIMPNTRDPKDGGGSSLTAGGPGSITFRPPTNQFVESQGQWNDGRWQVVLVRQLKVPEGEGVSLAAGAQASIAVAIWDGAKGDRNGQKLVSIWQDVELKTAADVAATQ
ncbi:MAG: c-type cytochrome [Pirellulales bacterium]|nr:c-type cytochrome [Pirellulales bacterium]